MAGCPARRLHVLEAGLMSDYGKSSLDLLISASAYRLGKNIEESKGWWKGKQAWGETWKSTIHD